MTALATQGCSVVADAGECFATVAIVAPTAWP
jgi:hypothetical protein